MLQHLGLHQSSSPLGLFAGPSGVEVAGIIVEPKTVPVNRDRSPRRFANGAADLRLKAVSGDEVLCFKPHMLQHLQQIAQLSD